MVFLPMFVGIFGMYILVGVATFFGSLIAWSFERFGFARTILGVLALSLLTVIAFGVASLAAAPPAERLGLAQSAWNTAVSVVIGRDRSGFPRERFFSIAVVVFAGYTVVTRLYARAHGLTLPTLARVLYASALFAIFTVFCSLVPLALARGISGTRLAVPAAIIAVLAFTISSIVYPRELARSFAWPAPHPRRLGRRMGWLFAVTITLMAFILREWVVVGMAGAMTVFLILEAFAPAAWVRKTSRRASKRTA